jgi:hypothetical protein
VLCRIFVRFEEPLRLAWRITPDVKSSTGAAATMDRRVRVIGIG